MPSQDFFLVPGEQTAQMLLKMIPVQDEVAALLQLRKGSWRDEPEAMEIVNGLNLSRSLEKGN